jgi:hypothetical protein
VQLDFDIAKPVKVKASAIRVESPPVGLFPLHRVPTAHRLESRKSWSLTTLAATVEGPEGAIEASERPSAYRHTLGMNVGSHCSKFSERPALIEERDRSALPSPSAAAVFQRSVVQLALTAQQILKSGTLPNGRL